MSGNVVAPIQKRVRVEALCFLTYRSQNFPFHVLKYCLKGSSHTRNKEITVDFCDYRLLLLNDKGKVLSLTAEYHMPLSHGTY